MKERNSGLVVLLMLVTCGAYYLYWIYRTSCELMAATDDPTISPLLDLVLTVVTCGLGGLYVQYRDAQKLHTLLGRLEPEHRDQSTAVLVLCLATFLVWVTGLVATYLVQEEFNRLARAGMAARPSPQFAPPSHSV